MKEFTITRNEAGQRADKLLAKYLKEAPKSFLYKMMRKKNITLNGKKMQGNEQLSEGDVLRLFLAEETIQKFQGEESAAKAQAHSPSPRMLPNQRRQKLDIIYEDSDVLLVNKPKDMVVHPSAGHMDGTLVNGLLYHCRDSLSSINGVMRPGIVHRIDKDTIAEQLKVHSITRKYHAIVWNNLKADEGTVDAPIGRHPVDRKKMAVNYKNGKNAVTHYKVLERFGKYTYIECELETGRTHQIRVHMASIGYPLLGDPVYGPSKQPFKLQGQVLHAKVLGFIHPTSGAYMEFETPLPEYFQELLEKLRHSAS